MEYLLADTLCAMACFSSRIRRFAFLAELILPMMVGKFGYRDLPLMSMVGAIVLKVP